MTVSNHRQSDQVASQRTLTTVQAGIDGFWFTGAASRLCLWCLRQCSTVSCENRGIATHRYCRSVQTHHEVYLRCGRCPTRVLRQAHSGHCSCRYSRARRGALLQSVQAGGKILAGSQHDPCRPHDSVLREFPDAAVPAGASREPGQESGYLDTATGLHDSEVISRCATSCPRSRGV
jgi:hypothetical protein